MKLILGFDELYVLVKKDKIFYNECLYSYKSVKKLFNELKKNEIDIKFMTLEQAIYKGITI